MCPMMTSQKCPGNHFSVIKSSNSKQERGREGGREGEREGGREREGEREGEGERERGRVVCE